MHIHWTSAISLRLQSLLSIACERTEHFKQNYFTALNIKLSQTFFPFLSSLSGFVI